MSATRLWAARLLVVLLLGVTLSALWATVSGASPTAEPSVARTGGSGESGQPSKGGTPAQPPEGGTTNEGATTHQDAEKLSPTAIGLIASLYILVLAGFVGFEVIGGVSPLLHTPLMSATNAISAISIVGALVIAGSADYPDLSSRILGVLAVLAASINVVGGFMITDRMLKMFRAKGVKP